MYFYSMEMSTGKPDPADNQPSASSPFQPRIPVCSYRFSRKLLLSTFYVQETGARRRCESVGRLLEREN